MAKEKEQVLHPPFMLKRDEFQKRFLQTKGMKVLVACGHVYIPIKKRTLYKHWATIDTIHGFTIRDSEYAVYISEVITVKPAQ